MAEWWNGGMVGEWRIFLRVFWNAVILQAESPIEKFSNAVLAPFRRRGGAAEDSGGQRRGVAAKNMDERHRFKTLFRY